MKQRQREILCIDDDMQSLQVRRILLETYGFGVLTAIGGREGLRAFRQHSVDAVIMDYHMPDLDGGQVASLMKRQRPTVPVLILSALPWLPEDAPTDCIDAFVSKGEPTARLVRKIETLIENHPQVGPKSKLLRGVVAAGRVVGYAARMLQGVFVHRKRPARPAPSNLRPLPARSSRAAPSECPTDKCSSTAAL